MDQNYHWIRTSLFSSTDNWHFILKEGINPLINNLDKETLMAHQIELNYIRGENIRLAFLSSDQNAIKLAQLVDAHFKRYFSNTQLQKHGFIPGKDLFMPFPENTIQYGLYDIDVYPEIEKYQVEQELAHLIIHSFEENFDDQTVLTLALYLHLVILKILHSSFPEYLAILPGLYKGYADMSIGNGALSDIPEMLENTTLLREITNDVFTENNFAHFTAELAWLQKWFEICQNKIISSIEGHRFEKTHADLSTLVAKHLGLSGFFQAMLYNLIGTSIDYIPKSSIK